jgi:AcrR family transcriptional regulator
MNAKKLPNQEADTAQKLIEVAIELFSTAGFAGTSIRDIAKATGMSISNIYYYFGNKDGLLLAILEHSSRHLVDSLSNVAELEMEPLERFKLLVRTHLQLVKLHKRESKIFFLDEDHLAPEGLKINKKFQLDILNIYRHEIEILKEQGYINYQHLTVLAFNILGVVNWHLRWYRPSGPLSLDELTEEIMIFILKGVLNGPASVAGPISTIDGE